MVGAAALSAVHRLRAGPAVAAGGGYVIPIVRATSLTVGPAVSGSLAPVAVIVIRRDQVSAWDIDGQPSSVERWAGEVDGLGPLVADLLAQQRT